MTATNLIQRHVFITNDQGFQELLNVATALMPFAIDALTYFISPVSLMNIPTGQTTAANDIQGYDCYIFTTNDSGAVAAIQQVQTTDSVTLTTWALTGTYGL